MSESQTFWSRASRPQRTSWWARLGLTAALSVLGFAVGTVGCAWAAGGSGGAGSGYYVAGACADGDGSTDGWTAFNTDNQALTSFEEGCSR